MKRDTYKYYLILNNRIVHGGITDNLQRRLAEHLKNWPGSSIRQIGVKTTHKKALKWERIRLRKMFGLFF